VGKANGSREGARDGVPTKPRMHWLDSGVWRSRSSSALLRIEE
jgi:hypothetical protein